MRPDRQGGSATVRAASGVKHAAGWIWLISDQILKFISAGLEPARRLSGSMLHHAPSWRAKHPDRGVLLARILYTIRSIKNI